MANPYGSGSQLAAAIRRKRAIVAAGRESNIIKKSRPALPDVDADDIMKDILNKTMNRKP